MTISEVIFKVNSYLQLNIVFVTVGGLCGSKHGHPCFVSFLSLFFERGKRHPGEKTSRIYTFLVYIPVLLCPALAIGLSLLLLSPSHSEEGKYTSQLNSAARSFPSLPFSLTFLCIYKLGLIPWKYLGTSASIEIMISDFPQVIWRLLYVE